MLGVVSPANRGDAVTGTSYDAHFGIYSAEAFRVSGKHFSLSSDVRAIRPRLIDVLVFANLPLDIA